jgi:hypothetical protein
MHLSEAGGRDNRRVQVLPMRPGAFPLGSPQSRAAARSLLAERKASKEEQLRFQAVSMLDGSPLNLDGWAETIRAARMRNRAGELPAALPQSEDGQESNGERRADCLSERIRKARERVGWAQGPETMR